MFKNIPYKCTSIKTALIEIHTINNTPDASAHHYVNTPLM